MDVARARTARACGGGGRAPLAPAAPGRCHRRGICRERVAGRGQSRNARASRRGRRSRVLAARRGTARGRGRAVVARVGGRVSPLGGSHAEWRLRAPLPDLVVRFESGGRPRPPRDHRALAVRAGRPGRLGAAVSAVKGQRRPPQGRRILARRISSTSASPSVAASSTTWPSASARADRPNSAANGPAVPRRYRTACRARAPASRRP